MIDLTIYMLIPFFLSAILVIPLIWIARKLNFLDYPNERSSHKEPTPLLGGAAIVISFYFCLTYFSIRTGTGFHAPFIYFLPMVLFLLGLYDDFRKTTLDYKIKLFIEAILAIGFIQSGFVLILTQIIIVDKIITLIWVIGFINAFNLLDNMNGHSASVALIASGFMGIFFISHHLHDLVVLSLVLAGSIAGFLMFNFPRAKIFMGDAGSLFIGALISLVSIKFNNSIALELQSVPIFFTLCFLIIPFSDTLFVTISRLAAGNPIYVADQKHLSHQLVKKGFSPAFSVIILALVALIFASVPLFMLSFS
ncbi:MAG: undecaprenyl/decaprenyl-phosphate alpha-N-acetylglucosaminyl 1-phosphate transferase [Calditrichaeota bacterium]|nr:MAG: undecaprenyl/decaprenyl-phosphate alpha-N-acetylglucosaminyl 1-phosphate transferase [Calditrichota bacterium]